MGLLYKSNMCSSLNSIPHIIKEGNYILSTGEYTCYWLTINREPQILYIKSINELKQKYPEEFI